MIPDHPMLAIYVLGAYGWLSFVALGAFLRPERFAALAEQSGLSRATFAAVVAVAYSVLWPLAICVVLAQINSERKG